MILVESDKASVEVPSTGAGVIKEIHILVGDRISEGDLLFTLDSDQSGDAQKLTQNPTMNLKQNNQLKMKMIYLSVMISKQTINT